MKSMKKVLASLLALAMVVTAVPVTNTSAATGVSLNNTTPSVYASKSKNIKVTVGSAWKNVKVKKATVSSSDEDVVRAVKLTNKKVKITGVSAGTAKVTFKVTGKKNGVKTTKTLTATVTVKPVTITAVSEETQTMTVGDTTAMFTVKPSGKKLATESDNLEVATVDEYGNVTAVGVGTATITASSKYGNSATVTVEVKTEDLLISSAKQTATNTLTAVFSGDASDVTASDITITNDDTSANVAVKSAVLDSTDTTNATLTITTYTDMTDGKDYTVKYGDSEAYFTATDGTIDHVSVNTKTVVYATATAMKAVFYDENDVKLGTAAYGATSYNSHVLTFTIETEDGYTYDDNLYLYEVGDTAVANITYHSGEYDDYGTEINNIVSGNITITAIDKPSVTGLTCKFSTDGSSNYSAVTATKVAAGDTAYAYIQLALSDGSTSVNASAYTFESSDEDTMTIDSSNATSGIITITANKSGTAYIIVKDSSGSTVKTFALTIYSARKAASVTLDNTSVSLSTATTVISDSSVAIETATVTPTVYDQYGEKMTYGTGYKLGYEYVTTTSAKFVTLESTGKFTVDVTSAENEVTAGKTKTYTVKVTATSENDGSASRTFTVTAKRPVSSVVAKYGVEVDQSKVDAIITKYDSGDKVVTATLYGYDANGVKNSVVSGAAFTLAKGSSTVTEDATKGENAVTSGAIHINDVKTGIQMATGTYKLTLDEDSVDSAVYNLVSIKVATFVVTNTQPKATASVEYISGTSTSLDSYIQVTYDGTSYGVDTDNALFVSYYNGSTTKTSLSTGKNYISSITVEIPVGSYKLVQTIDIGKTITVSE